MAFKSFVFLLLPFLLISTGSANERNENQEPKNSNNHKIYRLSLKPQVSNLIDKSIYSDRSTYADFDINKSNDPNSRSKQLDLKRPIIKHDELIKRESESNETYNELAVNSKQINNVDDNQYDSDASLIISNNNQSTLSANLGLKKEAEINSNNLKDVQSNNKSDDKTSNLGNDILKDHISNISEAHLDANLKKDKDEKSKDSSKYETATAMNNYSVIRRDRSSDDDDEDDEDDDESSDDDENNEDKNEPENAKRKTKENAVSENDLEDDSNEKKLKKILKKLIDKEEKKSKDKVISLINSLKSEKNKIKKELEQYKKELLIHKMKSEKEKNDQDKSNSTDAVSFISTKESTDTAIANQSIAIANLNQERTTESSIDSQSNDELSSAYEVDTEPIFATTVSSLPNAKEESMNKVTDVKFNYNSNTESPVTTASKDLIIDDIEIQLNTIIPKIYVHSNKITNENEEPTTLKSDEIY